MYVIILKIMDGDNTPRPLKRVFASMKSTFFSSFGVPRPMNNTLDTKSERIRERGIFIWYPVSSRVIEKKENTMYKKFEMELAGRTLLVDVDRVAKQAYGAVLMHYGDTTVLCTATASEKPREGIDFFPLSVEYNERMYGTRVYRTVLSRRLKGMKRKL